MSHILMRITDETALYWGRLVVHPAQCKKFLPRPLCQSGLPQCWLRHFNQQVSGIEPRPTRMWSNILLYAFMQHMLSHLLHSKLFHLVFEFQYPSRKLWQARVSPLGNVLLISDSRHTIVATATRKLKPSSVFWRYTYYIYFAGTF